MQKLTKLLEQYAQWLALGIAGVFVLGIVYVYWLNAPVALDLDNKHPQETPSHIDASIAEPGGALSQLKQRMADQSGKAPEVENYPDQVVAQLLRTSNLQPPALAYIGGPIEVSDVKVPPGGGGEPLPPDPKLARLPKVIPPLGIRYVCGQSVTEKGDKVWITIICRPDGAAQLVEFDAAKIPEKLRQAPVYLDIEMEREEKLSNNTWSKPEIVPPVIVDAAKVLTYPYDVDMIRTDTKSNADKVKAAVEALNKYESDARLGSDKILRRPFWTCSGGDIWSPDPPASQPTVITPPIVSPPPDHTTPPVGGGVKPKPKDKPPTPTPTPTPKNPPKGGYPPTFGPPTGTDATPKGGFPSANAVYHAAPIELAADVERPAYAPDPRMDPRDPRNWPRDSNGRPIPPNGYGPAGGGAPYSPPDLAVPRMMNPPVAGVNTGEIWSHDDNVQPGKTYRYRLRVKIKNPLFDTVNIAANQKDANIFILPPQNAPDEGWSAWSAEITMPLQMHYFVRAGAQRKMVNGQTVAGDTVEIDIFRWQGGKQVMKTCKLSPGDPVADPDGSVDSGWIVADIRPGDRSETDSVILVDQNGNVDTRTPKGDKDKDQYKRLQDQSKSAAITDAKTGH